MVSRQLNRILGGAVHVNDVVLCVNEAQYTEIQSTGPKSNVTISLYENAAVEHLN